MSKQSKPANPSDLLTHPAVVQAIKQNARRLSKIRLFRRVAREDIAADLRLEVAIRLQVFDPALSSIGTFASKAAHNGAPRLSCQTIAFISGRPVRRFHKTVVSR